MSLTPDQAAAASTIIEAVKGGGQVVLSGYAGTGKSYTTGHIAARLDKMRLQVIALTHAHKALAVLRDMLPAHTPTSTVFSALGWRIDPRTGERLEGGRSKLSGYDVVIVDEASMIDADMLSAITRDAGVFGFGVLWVGDPAQLPPVGDDSGNVPPVFAAGLPELRLEKIVRQAEGSPIIRASMYVREQMEAGRPICLDEMQRRAGDDDRVQVIGKGAAVAADWLASAMRAGLDARYIAWTNRAVERVNRIAHALVRGAQGERFGPGDPVTFGTSYYKDRTGAEMVAATDAQGVVVGVKRESGVNGCLGLETLSVTVRLGQGEETITAPCDGEGFSREMRSLVRQRRNAAARVAYHRQHDNPDQQALAESDRDDLGALIAQARLDYADLRHCYAITAHKAQGSTFDAVLVDWTDLERCSDEEQRARLLYVSCTRASDYLIVLA